MTESRLLDDLHISEKGCLWYFAYGSNLCRTQTKRRLGTVPTAQVAELRGYRLVFNKRSNDGTGKANLVPNPHHSVWGVIYCCTEPDIKHFDFYEGVEWGHYRHEFVRVITATGQAITALTYVAGEDFIDQALWPSADYLETILEGAKEHGLPAVYIAQLWEWKDRI
ncbi:gamma-glutamylcyclotransferase [Thermosynechococcus sichuanensis E542]|uniref:Gamma-glutamylcyclotransferase n=1 Tax=Thermosynechococcus sichuanensis E542 TaxID=2016101 RepID=A0A3B7MFE5_9CYAN|nr:gamma-glutamylcyclotransferase family protein [Thermosynechococcus vestitus]AXY68358.1 gamma-glutamylcyclotransferase [Thermosynechococcus vestitus E542]